ncbi:MAG: PilN domain-containing protein [Patescibacteria group bacterium]
MITLNLIPARQKTLLKNARLYTTCKEAATLLFLFVAIISIMLWVSRYYLERDLADLVIANAGNIESNEATSQRIIAINQKIKLTDGISDNFISARRIIEAIANALPENIALETINFYRQQAILEITGTAKTRDNLLRFKNTLSAEPWIKNVDLPMINLIDKENNRFTIKLEINPDRL